MPVPGAPVGAIPGAVCPARGRDPSPALPDVLPLMPGKHSPAAPGWSRLLPNNPWFCSHSSVLSTILLVARFLHRVLQHQQGRGKNHQSLRRKMGRKVSRSVWTRGCHVLVPVPVLLPTPDPSRPSPAINRAQITSLHRWVPALLSPWLHNI